MNIDIQLSKNRLQPRFIFDERYDICGIFQRLGEDVSGFVDYSDEKARQPDGRKQATERIIG